MDRSEIVAHVSWSPTQGDPQLSTPPTPNFVYIGCHYFVLFLAWNITFDVSGLQEYFSKNIFCSEKKN